MRSSFEFLAPRHVVAGNGSARETGAKLREAGAGDGTVIVVADRVVAERGLCDTVIAGLDAVGFRTCLRAEIDGEPAASTVSRLADAARAESPVAIVGVGGGSAMDSAKLVALLVRNELELESLGRPLIPAAPVAPLALVPTTTGTGAEATRIAMVSVGGAKLIVSCVQFVPLVAVLDPELVRDLPTGVVSATALDALAHALESALSTNRTPATLELAERAAQLVVGNVLEAVTPEGAAARGQLLYSAYLAGLALNAGVVLGHSLGYVIAREAHLTHGVSCALALPYCLAYNNQDVDADLATAITQAVSPGGKLAEPPALAVAALTRRLDLPQSLRDVSIERARLPVLAKQTVSEYPRPNNPVPLDEGRVLRLLECMYDGSVEDAVAMLSGLPA